jgi:hypothetical protein
MLAIGLVLAASARLRTHVNSHACWTINEVLEPIIVPASEALWAACTKDIDKLLEAGYESCPSNNAGQLIFNPGMIIK